MMSWRSLIIFFLLLFAASAWGGYLLGNWLIKHGPTKVPSVAMYEDVSTMPVLGADGKPFKAQPPQPLVNGRLGIPEEDPEPLDWQLEQAYDLFREAPPISLATTPISMSEAIRITNRADNDGLQGIASLGKIQPIEADEPPPPPSQDVVETDGMPLQGNWQALLQEELDACQNVGFFKRPSCSWDARNKYCGPNNAWGQVPNCPKKDF